MAPRQPTEFHKSVMMRAVLCSAPAKERKMLMMPLRHARLFAAASLRAAPMLLDEPHR